MEQASKQKNYARAEELYAEQNLAMAGVMGVFATVCTGLIYGLVVSIWSFSSGFAVAGIGLLIGLSVQYFGRGVQSRFAVLAGLSTIVACALGRVLVEASPSQLLKTGEIAEAVQRAMSSLTLTDLVFWFVALVAAVTLAKRTLSRADSLAIDTYEMKGYSSD